MKQEYKDKLLDIIFEGLDTITRIFFICLAIIFVIVNIVFMYWWIFIFLPRFFK